VTTSGVGISVEHRGAATWIWLDRPARGNALRPSDMAAAAAAIRAARGVAIVLAGRGGRSFSGGYDLDALGGANPAAERLPELLDLVDALECAERVTIAAIEGPAVGGGALWASLCDLRIAGPRAEFSIPATRIGVLYPLAGLRRLVGLVGPHTAGEILLGGVPMTAEDGRESGLWSVAEDAIEAAEAACRRLATRAPLALAATAAMLRRLPGGDVDALHAAWSERCIRSADFSEGLAAARARREPQFRGA
jgi:enoyl-CoA hydratase/carnithine racemase